MERRRIFVACCLTSALATAMVSAPLGVDAAHAEIEPFASIRGLIAGDGTRVRIHNNSVDEDRLRARLERKGTGFGGRAGRTHVDLQAAHAAAAPVIIIAGDHASAEPSPMEPELVRLRVVRSSDPVVAVRLAPQQAAMLIRQRWLLDSLDRDGDGAVSAKDLGL